MLRDANPKAFSGIYLYDSDVIHADETPFQVIRDNRSPGSKSYMWVYRNSACGDRKPVVLYDYHTLEKKREGLKIAGCWVHCKRKYDELVKAVGRENSDGLIAAKAVDQISKIFLPEARLQKPCSTALTRNRFSAFSWMI